MKRIGILTSGGDCPGLNAGIVAAYESLVAYKCVPVLLQDGYKSLIDPDPSKIIQTPISALVPAFRTGGSILGASRTNLDKKDNLKRAAAGVETLELDGLIIFGGDGSLKGAGQLAKLGIPIGAIPKTIDNDVMASDLAIGFSTASNTGMRLIDDLYDTALTHHTWFIVEVMGRQSGMLASAIAQASNATGVIVPEHNWTLSGVESKLNANIGGVIVISEGAWSPSLGLLDISHTQSSSRNVASRLTKKLSKVSKCNIRSVTLGHTLRGGKPTLEDRILAVSSAKCVTAEVAKKRSILAVVKNGIVEGVHIKEVSNGRRFLTIQECHALGNMLVVN
jgi:6-phosphofructokinase 1